MNEKRVAVMLALNSSNVPLEGVVAEKEFLQSSGETLCKVSLRAKRLTSRRLITTQTKASLVSANLAHSPVLAQQRKDPLDGLPWREGVGKSPPGATAANYVEDGG
jgi:hypothetical protein